MHKSIEDMAKDHNMTVEDYKKAVDEGKIKYPRRFLRATAQQPKIKTHKY